MSSKGKLYTKYLEQAKYVVKGKKLKIHTVIIRQKKSSSNVVSYNNFIKNKKEQYIEDNNQCSYIEDNKQYSEVEFEFEENIEEDVQKANKVVPIKLNDEKTSNVNEIKIEELKKEELKIEDMICLDKEKNVNSRNEELTKEYVEAKVKELKKKEEMALEKSKKLMADEKVKEKLDNLVTQEERNRGIINERKDNISKNQLDELERLRLLELARVKKETLEKERIEKAKAKKEEKIKQEIKIKQRAEKKNVELLQEKKDSIDKRKKARRDESKTFVIVAALLAIIIVAGMANLGGMMFNEIQKDNILVGETDKEEKNNSSLLDNLYNNINSLNKDNSDNNTEQKTGEKIDSVEESDNEVGLTDDKVVVAQGENNTTSNLNENTSNKNVNSNNLMESIENIKLPVDFEETTQDEIPNFNDNFNNNLGEQTGTIVVGQEEKYVEIKYEGTDFKLYTTTKNNIKKSFVIAGGCKEYVKHNYSNGTIKIPKNDAVGIWFVVKNGKIDAEFAFENSSLLGIATLILMQESDGVEVEDDIIYAKQGTSVVLGGTYYTKDDEGNKILEFETVPNVIGKMILYKK